MFADKDQLLYDLFDAYYDCRKNKRNTANQLKFEMEYETNLINLWKEILNGTYQPKNSIAFISHKPVKREIFAASFRDRIVHHYIINKLNPYFEEKFIYDSYSCRKGKGTLFGINRARKFMRSCSRNYQQDCYIFKLDIKGFFMSIDKDILYQKLLEFIERKYKDYDKYIILELVKKIVYNDPTKDCIIKSNRGDWKGLPRDKSLFYSGKNNGLPIGNLTSQVFANLYLDEFDHWMKKELKCKYYGRYVDDFFIFSQDKEYLKSLIPKIRIFLKDKLNLKLHQKKIYFQHYKKGFLFLGAYIKPYRTYLKNATKNNIYGQIQLLNNQIRNQNGKITNNLQKEFQQSINSYLGLIKQHNTYKLRKKIFSDWISVYWWNYFYVSCNVSLVKNKVKVVG